MSNVVDEGETICPDCGEAISYPNADGLCDLCTECDEDDDEGQD